MVLDRPVTIPGALISDTILLVHDRQLFAATGALSALREWLQFHTVPYQDLPLGSPITRDVRARRVYFDRVVRDEHGWVCRRPTEYDGDRTVVDASHEYVQGDTPPLPWPQLILDLMTAHQETP